MKTEKYHIPVLLQESVGGLVTDPDGIFVDATFGGGGHSAEILRLLKSDGRLFGFDQDEDAIANAIDDKRFTFVRSNFRYLKNFLRYYGVEKFNGLIADLGVSSHHFDDRTRGFSFRFEGPLDMRMNKQSGKTAADIVNSYSEEKLADIFYLYGELRQARKLARCIAKARDEKPITDIESFLNIIRPLAKGPAETKNLACIFQSLRIEVNDEIGALKDMLEAASEMLLPKGRLVILTYHSIEDRIVKNFMKSGNIEGKVEKDLFGRTTQQFKLIGKAIAPSEGEIVENPRSRSAKLRIAEKL